MVEGRLRYHIDGKFKKCPEYNCLMSSADSSWSGFLVERQRCEAPRLSVPVSVHNPRLLLVTRGELTGARRAGRHRYKDRWKPGRVIFLDRGYQLDEVSFDDVGFGVSWEHTVPSDWIITPIGAFFEAVKFPHSGFRPVEKRFRLGAARAGSKQSRPVDAGPRLYPCGALRAPKSYQSNWILFWQADWSVRN
jgi:hypothetical protein